MQVDRLIEQLGLQPHPEGGFYRETYRAADLLNGASLPSRYGSGRSVSTCIYYLLTPDSFSAMHRVQSDEIFHFYLGDAIEMLQLFPDGQTRIAFMGQDLEKGQQPQLVIPHGVWQGSRLTPGGKFALIGATVAPGFDFSDFEIGNRSTLIEQYPEQQERITQLTRE